MPTQSPNQKIEVKVAANQVTDFLRSFILAGIFVIILFPILGDYGNLLYPVGREILFRMIVEIILVAYIFLIILDRRYLPRFSLDRNPKGISVGSVLTRFSELRHRLILFSLILFWLFFGLATIFSQDLKFSFWGSFYRGGGFFTLTHFVIFFIILTSVLKTWQQWKKIIFSAIFVSFPITILTIIQFFLAPNRDKIVSTLNNPNFLAAYLLSIFFFTVYFCYSEKKGWLKNFLILTSLLQVISIILTESRGALLGLVLGILILIFLFGSKEPKKIKIISGSVLAVIILFSIFFLNTSYGKSFLKNNPFSSRLINSVQSLKEGGRLDAWRAAFLGLKEKPFLGYGPENFNIPFDKFYLATQEKSKFVDTFFDKAHSNVIEMLATTGILGLLSYLMIFGVAAFLLLRNLKEYATLKIILFSTLIAYFIQDLFNIDTITIFIYFYLWLALINFVSQEKNMGAKPKYQNYQTEKITKKQKLIFYLGLILLIPLLFVSLNKYHLDFLMANYQNNKANEYFVKNDYNKSFETYEKGLKRWTYLSHDLYHKYASALMVAASQINSSDPNTAKALAQKALDMTDKAVKDQPYFNRTWILEGVISNFFIENKQLNYKEKADYYFGKAIEMSPERPFTWINWGNTDLLMGNYGEAKKKYEKAKEIYPADSESYFMLGIVSLYEKKNEEAQEYFAIARENFAKNNFSGFNPASNEALSQRIKPYVKNRDYNNLIKLYTWLQNRNPGNFQYGISLAVVQREMGNFAEARKTMENLFEKFPQLKTQKNIQQFIETLQ